jgi:hypothetical protein
VHFDRGQEADPAKNRVGLRVCRWRSEKKQEAVQAGFLLTTLEFNLIKRLFLTDMISFLVRLLGDFGNRVNNYLWVPARPAGRRPRPRLPDL